MTTFAFALLGTAGDILPCLPVARLLRERGSRILLLVNEHFAPLVVRHGLEPTPVSSAQAYLNAVQTPKHWGRTGALEWSLKHYLGESIAPMFHALTALSKQDTVIVCTRNAYGARFAHEATGMPLYSTLYSPAFHATPRRLPYPQSSVAKCLPRPLVQAWVNHSTRRWIDGPTVPLLNEHRRALGLPPVSSYAHAHLGKMLAFYPGWFDDLHAEVKAGTALQGDFVSDPSPDGALSPQLEAFLAKGESPIVFTFGTGVAHLQSRFDVAAQWAQRTQTRAVFLTSFTANLPRDIPANVLVQDYADLAVLLPRCAALVHHGGIGTSVQGMRAGIPQLVLPIAYDQPDNGHRIRQLKAGTVWMRNLRSPQDLDMSLKDAFKHADSIALTTLRARLQHGLGPQLIADLLEQNGGENKRSARAAGPVTTASGVTPAYPAGASS